MSAVTAVPFVGIMVKEEEEDALMVLPDLMMEDDSSAKRKFEIEEEKPDISGSPIKFREFASVANMEASASKRPKLVTGVKNLVTPDKKVVTTEKKAVTVEQCPGNKKYGKETEKQQKVVEKAMADIVGHPVHYQMSGGAFYLEKAAVLAMLNGKRINGTTTDIFTERIGDVEFVSLKSLESAVKKDGATCEDNAFNASLLSRDAIQSSREISRHLLGISRLWLEISHDVAVGPFG